MASFTTTPGSKVLDVKFRITGVNHVKYALTTLPEKIQRRVLRGAVTKATRLLVRAVKEETPQGKPRVWNKKRLKGGALKKSIHSKVKTYTKTNTVVGIVGPRYKGAPHAHLVHEGTVERWRDVKTRNTVFSRLFRRLKIQKKGKHYLGRVKPNRYVTRGLAKNQASYLSRLQSEIALGVQREASKLGAEQPQAESESSE